MITKSTIPSHEYTSSNYRFELNQQDLNARPIAVLAAVSQEAGVDLVMTFKDSINISKFIIFIEELRRTYYYGDLCIYFDNLAVHRSLLVRQRLEDLSIGYVFCLPYSPDLNGIESVFSIFKNKLKRLRLMAIEN